MLIKRVYEIDPLACPHCGGQMKVVAFIEPPQAPVIWSTAWCETGSTFVNTLFFKSGEGCSNIAQEVVMVIENVHIFLDFYKALTINNLWSGHFFELADNGLLDYTVVVVVCE